MVIYGNDDESLFRARKYESLKHIPFGGAERTVPLSVTENGIDSITTALYDATTIIGGVYPAGISELRDRVGEILTSDKQPPGLIIEDELGGGSVVIGGVSSTIRFKSKPDQIVPTETLFDLLFKWAEEEKTRIQ